MEVINNQRDDLLYLRSLSSIVLPKECTYFNHCTGFIPKEVKEKTKTNIYKSVWESIPIEEFKIIREMSFSERKSRIESVLIYGNSLKNISVLYSLKAYAKPFMIRVIMPKKDFIDYNNPTPYQKELIDIYRGLGDQRHEKLPGNTGLLVFASSQVDEMSGKKIDIVYCIREQDLAWYTQLVKETLDNRYPQPYVMPQELNRESDFSFLNTDYLLEKDKDFSRYTVDANGMSEILSEYYHDYEGVFAKYYINGVLEPIDMIDSLKINKDFNSRYDEKREKQ